MRGKITSRSIAALKPGEWIADSEVLGFRARRLPSGMVTYGFQYRNPDERRLRWLSLGMHGELTVDQARRAAKMKAGEVAADRDPAAERDAKGTDSLNAMLDNFLKRYVDANGLRSAPDIRRRLEALVRPRLGAMSIYWLTRSEMSKLFDEIEDKNGPVQADRVLAYLRKAFNWQMARDDRFTSPIIKGMARSKPADRQRKRILADDEIRDLWRALDELGARAPVWFPSFVRTLLLTGQRVGNVSSLQADAIKGDVWEIRAEPRRKLKHGLIVPLSVPVRAMFTECIKRGDEFLFAYDFKGDGPVRARFSKPMMRLNRVITAARKHERREPMEPWTPHDLRRTARSIMSQYTSPDIAERAIGHTMSGVRGVYDRYEYLEEKRAAFEALARHVMAVVGPQDGGKVVRFPKRKATKRAAA